MEDTESAAAALKAWQARMGLSYTTAAKAIGVGRSTYAAYIRGINDKGKPAPISRTVLLACAAIEAGLPPVWGSEKEFQKTLD